MKQFLAATISICLFLFSCKKSSDNNVTVAKDIILPDGGSSVVDANNQFGLKFTQALLSLQNDNTQNQLISPLSLYMALAMVYNGANNATKDSIQKALQLQGVDINTLNSVASSLMTQMPNVDGKVSFSIANAIFVNKQYTLEQSFLDILKNSYSAKAQSLDFISPNSIDTINKWVADNTDNKISKIIDGIRVDNQSFLINAIYFKAAWKDKFDPKETVNLPFHLMKGTSIQVPFMTRYGNISYHQDENVEIVQLPYGDGNFSMSLLLPKEGMSPTDLLANLTMSDIKGWQFHNLNNGIYVPKFKYAYSITDFKPELAKLGMSIASDPYNADFTKMYPSGGYIDQTIHKTYIEVNEEGTEAAAVTTIGIIGTGAAPPVSFNRPFAYMIQEKSSGVILFIGIVNNPDLSGE